MGTNFYARTNNCEACHRCDRLHIGKSSVGWRFCFRSYDEWRPSSVEEWRTFLAREDVAIVDEYGETHGKDAFWSRVEAKQTHRSHDGGSVVSYAHDDVADLCEREFS